MKTTIILEIDVEVCRPRKWSAEQVIAFSELIQMYGEDEVWNKRFAALGVVVKQPELA